MENIKLNKQIIKSHLLNWSIVFILRHIVIPIEDGLTYQIFRSTIDFTVYISAYYTFCLLISPRITKNKTKWYFILLYILLFWIALYFLEFWPDMIIENEAFFLPPNYWIVNSVVYSFYIPLLSHGFYKKQISIQRLNSQTENEQTSILQETLFLRNQFSSGISLNVLDNCYNISQSKGDKEFCNVIDTYKDMMKYTLDIEQSKEVLIENEIAYIENYVKLQEGIGKQVCVQFHIDENSKKQMILPRILICFVENAFKYGVTDNPLTPVTIDLQTKKDILEFKISNYKNSDINQIHSTGTGLLNSNQQLNLYYPNRFNLEINNEKEIYTCVLNLKLISENDKMYNYR